MAKVTRIGCKDTILKQRENRVRLTETAQWLAGKSQEDLDDWCKEHFKDLPPQARKGIEKLTETLWMIANQSA